MHTFSLCRQWLIEQVVHDEGERGKAVLWLKVPVHVSQEGHSLG